MKRSFLICLILSSSNPLWPVAFVQSRSVNSGPVTSATLAFTSNNAAGNFIVVGVRIGDTGRTVTITDSNGNGYAMAKKEVLAVDLDDAFVFYSTNIAAGANTVTCAISGAAASMRWAIHEYSDIAASLPLDVAISANSTSAIPDSGSGTTSQASELLFGFAANINSAGSGSITSAGGNYTLREALLCDLVNCIGSEDRIASVAISTSATFNMDASGEWACIMTSFKAPISPNLTILRSGTIRNGTIR